MVDNMIFCSSDEKPMIQHEMINVIVVESVQISKRKNDSSQLQVINLPAEKVIMVIKKAGCATI